MQWNQVGRAIRGVWGEQGKKLCLENQWRMMFRVDGLMGILRRGKPKKGGHKG